MFFLLVLVLLLVFVLDLVLLLFLLRDAFIFLVSSPFEVIRLQKDAVESIKNDRVQIAHVAQRDRRERRGERQNLDDDLTRVGEVLPQQLRQLEAEDAGGHDADKTPEHSPGHRVGSDGVRHAVHRSLPTEPLNNGYQRPSAADFIAGIFLKRLLVLMLLLMLLTITTLTYTRLVFGHNLIPTDH